MTTNSKVTQAGNRTVLNFDAAIRMLATELTDKACCGVDTENEINPETGKTYGLGGHTGWLLVTEVRKLKQRITDLTSEPNPIIERI